MFSKVRFLTMEENSFAAVNAKTKKKPKENHFIPENALFYTQSLNNPPPPLIPTHFINKIIACPEGHFNMTLHFNKFVLTTPLLIRPPLKLSTEEYSTRTKLRHLARGRPKGKLSNP